MSPDLLFLLSLAVNMAVTALFVLVATYAAQRAGALVGAMIGNRFRHARMPLALRRWYDIPLRAGMVAILIALVVGLSARVGPTITGILAVFPIVLTSLMLILHPRIGGPATAAVEANSLLGLVGFALTCLTARLAVEPLGTAAGLSLALAGSIGCNLPFWCLPPDPALSPTM